MGDHCSDCSGLLPPLLAPPGSPDAGRALTVLAAIHSPAWSTCSAALTGRRTHRSTPAGTHGRRHSPSPSAGAVHTATVRFRAYSLLALWRGEELVGLTAGPELRSYTAGLAARRLPLLEQCIDAELRLGLHHTLVAELETPV
ncbi:BTAD domain-containing putative transcriptional regulator [Streptomyces sp. NPDC058374]|uniref:BTAD domain-containing putative transcriptional regulator n=1 Tax=Streptomyces sp. NPDC058374 TaxID=3346466 RepID=UPI003648FD6C